MIIEKTLEALKKLQGQCYTGEGDFEEFVCKYNPPLTLEEIRSFESKNKCIIPEDYKAFLLESNGMKFNISGELSLFSIQEIVESLKIMHDMCDGYKKGIYPIGFCLDDNIVIKSDEIPTGKYIYACDCYCGDEYFSLDCNFETFLDRYLITNACKYWRWIYPREYFNFLNN